jgi:O-antigen ligase
VKARFLPGTLEKLQKISWALFLLALPVTSFPYFPGGIGGKTLVRPLSVYPLLALLILVTIPRLLRKSLPKTFLPLFAFIIIALISSILPFSYGTEGFKGISMTSRILRNIITLGIGATIYLTVSLIIKSWDDLDASLRWLYAGFTAALAWGSLQAVYVIHYSARYFKLLSSIQNYISTRKLFPTRISGLTYEPKWFAEQICFLMLPWLLGSVLMRHSSFKWRFRWITVEWILLAWSVLVLIFTYSRTGLFILIILTFLVILLARPRARQKTPRITIKQRVGKRWTRLTRAILAVLVLGTIIIVASSQNRYFSRFWRYWTEEGPANKTYLEYIAFNQRFVYWVTAFRIYQAYPILGVGLGNYAFYFDEMLPNESWSRQPEIVRQITPVEGGDRLITPKNLYGRLLAETGLVGTAVFTGFVLAVLGCAFYLWFSRSAPQKFWGVSGFLGMIVFAIVVFSFDSVAIPNMWVVFGLITAAAHLSPPPDAESGPAVSQDLSPAK